MASSKMNISLPPEVAAQIETRTGKAAGERSGQIAGDLARYYEALARARKGLRSQFSESELGAVLDVCNGTVYEAHSLPWLYASVEDAAEDGLAAKWQIDAPALVAKLRGLSYIEAAALVDATERAWRSVGDGEINVASMLA